MYSALYARYDAILLKDAEERRRMAQRSMTATSAEEARRRNLLLEKRKQRFSELPAFSSMLHIEEVEQAMTALDCSSDATEEENSEQPNKMDGFERMRLCRVALDALDVAGIFLELFHANKEYALQQVKNVATQAGSARTTSGCSTRRTLPRVPAPSGSWTRQAPLRGRTRTSSSSTTGTTSRRRSSSRRRGGIVQPFFSSLQCYLTHNKQSRFGKTISVSMFAAALMFSCAGCEVSIYSTCKRISTKLLRNVVKFLHLIYDVLGCKHHKVIRANQEEVHLQGPEGPQDIRVIQSYPSKVIMIAMPFSHMQAKVGSPFYCRIDSKKEGKPLCCRICPAAPI